MRRNILLIGLALATAMPARAGTFAPKPIAPEYGVDVFTRSVARSMIGRDLFDSPYATVTISNVDVYDRFPYVESRHFEVVSDPRWNRLVFGELGQGFDAWSGAGSTFGALSGPRGLAVDEQDRLYVADAGNNRVLVFQAASEYGHMKLTPLYSIDGLGGPYGVAYSDGGTPFQPGDDMLFIAETGRNRVSAWSLGATGAEKRSELGDLGSGPGRFAGPMALTVGRKDGVNTSELYVADAHSRRIVHLRLDHGSLKWIGEAPIAADVVTSMDTDEWGNVYAAAPQQGVVRKFNPDLDPVADLHGGLSQPRSVHIPFFTVHDHRDGSVARVGQPNALSIDQWSEAGGVRLWDLGVSVDGLSVAGGDEPTASFTLTDQASVTLDVVNAADGHVLVSRPVGTMGAGAQSITLVKDDLRWIASPTDLMLRVSATSGYGNGVTATAQAPFHADGGGNVALPNQALLLGNWPNPARAFTRITFVLPQAGADQVSLSIYDASGRKLRTYRQQFSPGLNQVVWDATSEDGRPVKPGMYFYRLEAGKVSFTHRMAVVR